MTIDLNSRTWSIHDKATPAEQADAIRCIQRKAADGTEQQLLLDMLGLAPRSIAEHGMRGYRQGCRCRVCRRANAARTRRQRAVHVTSTADCPINTTRETV